MKKILIFILITSFGTTAYSHGGRTDKNGCHKDSRTGDRHCH
ncbi:YHYH domain-containing protein [Acinetobacter tibetensis]|uniref:YHYH domain-containing protein n=1 Tax=Acinetobacter tibetensis TaxID=2943497 RepID=A0AAE9LU70_9GAMM|nr:YHYH domain-containing protein [Acinetobacter tibetensis]USE84346.1 YHYH domain-containing protein [Acinetobacter tibetensis]